MAATSRSRRRADDLLREGDEVPPLALQLVEHIDAGERIPTRERIDEPLDGVLRGETQQVPDPIRVDDLIGGRQDLVEQRLGVAHPAGRQRGR